MNRPKPSKTVTSQSFQDIRDWQAILVIAGAVLMFFRDILLQKAFLWEDFLYQFYPFRSFAAVSLANGELPLWNPYTFCGMPFQADIQSAIFYIPNLLLTLFVSGGKLHFYWVELSIILHYVIAGAGMYYLAKDLGLRSFIALFSGLVFALSGFMILHAIHQVMIAQVAWFPLIVLLFRRALTNRSMLSMVGAGLVLGHAILAGFPQLTLYILFFLFLYCIFEIVYKSRREGIKSSVPMVFLSAGAFCIAAGLTAIQILPTMELASLSQRAQISYEKSLEGSLSVQQLLTLLIPNFFGTSGAQERTYWMSGGYFNYWETCIYVGIAGLAAALFAITLLRRNRYVGFLFFIAIFALLYALGDSFFLHKVFFFNVPGFDKFRDPGRMSLLFTFAASLLSGFGVQHIFEKFQTEEKRFRLVLFMAAGAVVCLWIIVRIGVFVPVMAAAGREQIHEIQMAESTTTLVLVLALCLILLLVGQRKMRLTPGIMALLMLQFIDVNVFGFDQNNSSVNPEAYFGRPSTIVRVLQREGKGEFFRVNARQGGAMILDRNQGMVDRIFLMEGYTPLALQRVYPPGRNWDQVCDMLNAKYRVVVDEQQRTMSLRQATTYLPRAYVVHEVVVVENDTILEGFMKSASFDASRMVVLEERSNLAIDNTESSPSSVSIQSYRLNSISLEVSTSSNGILVLSEIYFPDWNAYVDGLKQRILRGNWNQRAIPISAGSHHVEIVFEPQRFYRGAMITGGTLALSGAIIGFSFFKKRWRKV